MLRSSLAGVLLGGALLACAPTDDDPLTDPAAAIAGTGAVPAALEADSRIPVTLTWDATGRHPQLFAGEFPVGGASPEAAARGFLARHAGLLGVEPDGRDLALVTTRRGLAGTYLRFQRQVADVPVFDRQVVVAVAADGASVRAVNLGQHGGFDLPLVAADRGPLAAIAAAQARLGAIAVDQAPTAVRGIEVGDRPHLAYRVTVVTSAPIATWEVSVDAASGAILSVRDRNAYVDGTGLVFDMTPVASTGNTLLVDGNDQTTAALDAARVTVALPRLDGSGLLRGSWADAFNNNQRANEPSLTFAYDRHDDRFEEVMAYYHLDRTQNRIQALGFTDVDHRVQVARVNALTADNSFYSPQTKDIRYGSGGVDDAEDADIITHEYGHSIQDDQVPGWGGGDEASMGEGFGDYLAASFSETLPPVAGHAQPFGQYPCVGEWDATSYATGTPKCLRRTDNNWHAPEDTDGEVHDDGEIWSAGLWKARAAVGPDVMDKLVLESHFLLTTTETFNNAAVAVVTADQMLFAGSHRLPVRRALYDHGLLRVPQLPANFSGVVAVAPVLIESPHDGTGSYPAFVDDTRTFTRPGSLALRVHFANIELAGGGSCNDSNCDNLYLTDGAGDLYQILTQADNGPRTSVQIPGDTVNIRILSDGTNQAAGYVVDRIEAMGGTVAIDAAVDAPIDARPIDARPIDAALDARPPVDARPVDARPGDASAPVDGPSGDATSPGKTDAGGCCSTGVAPTSPAALGLLVAGGLLRRRRSRA